MEARLEREWQLLRSPAVLVANGILLFDQDQPAECGRLVFWLGELPHYTLFTTENGVSLERIKNNKVRLRFPTSKDEKLIDIPSKPRELLSDAGSTKHTRSVSDSSATATTSLFFSSFSSNPQLPSTTQSEHGTHIVKSKPQTTSSWWGRFSSGSSVPVQTTATTTTTTKSRPPSSELPSASPAIDKSSSRSSTNDRTRKKLTDGVGQLAENEAIQEKGGHMLAQLAKDKGVQSMVGDAIAESSDNSFMAKMARNPKVQEKIASKVSAAATNKTVQKKVGKMVRDFAENEDAQKKAASFLGSMIKSAANMD